MSPVENVTELVMEDENLTEGSLFVSSPLSIVAREANGSYRRWDKESVGWQMKITKSRPDPREDKQTTSYRHA